MMLCSGCLKNIEELKPYAKLSFFTFYKGRADSRGYVFCNKKCAKKWINNMVDDPNG